MSNFFSKLSMPLAAGQVNKFDLSCQHITTSDFFRLTPVYCKECIPNEKINVNVSVFTRLMPLQKPVYGSCNIVSRAFFVPMRTIMEGFDDFINDRPYKLNTYISHVPYFNNSTLKSFFVGLASETTSSAYDFELYSSSGNKFYNFNQTGRLAYHIFKSLGYQIDFSSPTVGDEVEMSAMPFLAFCKIYLDWYANPAFLANTRGLEDLFFSVNKELTVSDLQGVISQVLYCNYEKDYFTSAWSNPVSPNDMPSSNVVLTDSTLPSSSSKSKVNVSSDRTYSGTPFVNSISGSSTSVVNLTQFVNDTLHRVTDYVKRLQLAGTRTVDRYFARFGVSLPEANLRRSNYLGSMSTPIQISDVMSTSGYDSASPSSSDLGEYSGKGIGYGNGKFSFETKEYGYFVICSAVIPKVSYVQGRNRYLFHINKFDFHTQEYDGLGPQAIREDEIFSGYGTYHQNYMSGAPDPDRVFGYTSRYAEYKCAFDNLSGDFVLNSRNKQLDQWHFARIFSSAPVEISSTFGKGSNNTLNRIWNNVSSSYDHFINIFKFDVTVYAPMKKMFDDYEFDDDAQHHHQRRDINVNGSMFS